MTGLIVRGLTLILLYGGLAPAVAAPDYSADVQRAVRAGDYTRAVALLRERAEQGDTEAQLNLGLLLASDRNDRADPAAAAAWYERAAKGGNADAQNNLGRAYLEGAGVPRDATRAARWFRDAAQADHAGAQYNLGTLYAQGEGMTRDMNEAVRWWRRAAEQGVVAAQYNMGVASAEGVGTERSLAAAVYWYAYAAEAGDRRARRALDDTARRLPRKTVTASNVRVRAEATTESAILAELERGASVPVLGHDRQAWTMIYLDERHRIGWIASRLLGERTHSP